MEEIKHDPFATFNELQGAGRIRDPYPRFAELRSLGDMVKIDVVELMGGNAEGKDAGRSGSGIVEGFELWSAVSYESVSEVLRDSSRFNSAGYSMTIGTVMGKTILEMDPPEHTGHRGLLKQAFTKKAMDTWERQLVRPIVDGLIDRFVERGRADLVRELTFPFPVAVVARMIGVGEEDYDDFHRWAIELISLTHDFDLATESSGKLRGLFARILEERRERPSEDLISVLAAAELDGERLDDEAIFSFLRLLAPAGAETTYRSSSNLLYGLLSNPEQLEALRRNRDLFNQSFEEGLRWECPLLGIMRTAVEDTEVCGVEVKAGEIIHVNLGSANHDERRWDDPESFDIHRPPRQHMAFAFGTHSCLGNHLARMETRVVINAVLDRLPELRLDPEAENIHITGLPFRAPGSLPVVF